MIDDGWNLVVRADLEELRAELIALSDVDRQNTIMQAKFGQHYRDLVSIRRRPEIEINHTNFL